MNGLSGDVEEERVNTLSFPEVYSAVLRTINLILGIRSVQRLRSSFYHVGKV